MPPLMKKNEQAVQEEALPVSEAASHHTESHAAERSTQVKVGVQGDPESFMTMTKGKTPFATGKPDSIPVEEITNPGVVFNRLNHSMTMTYDGQAMVIAPRGRAPVANINKLSALRPGLQLIKQDAPQKSGNQD